MYGHVREIYINYVCHCFFHIVLLWLVHTNILISADVSYRQLCIVSGAAKFKQKHTFCHRKLPYSDFKKIIFCFNFASYFHSVLYFLFFLILIHIVSISISCIKINIAAEAHPCLYQACVNEYCVLNRTKKKRLFQEVPKHVR